MRGLVEPWIDKKVAGGGMKFFTASPAKAGPMVSWQPG